MAFDLSMPRAFGPALSTVVFRKTPQDFVVHEQLLFEPSGEGEHVYLQIRKTNANTIWVAKELARWLGVRQRDVSYAGLKDRFAVTTQWFSVQIPGKETPGFDECPIQDIEILKAQRHIKKLRSSMIKSNAFDIFLYELNCSAEQLQQKINQIERSGVPNYFGEQRFGKDAGNLSDAVKMFSGELNVRDRKKKGLYLSAARSYLFNRVLALRVNEQNWCKPVAGDCLMLNGSHSYFCIDAVDDELLGRIDEFDVHPTGPLWGRGDIPVTSEANGMEERALIEDQVLCRGLEQAGLKMDRRALRMQVHELRCEWLGRSSLKLSFTLGSGQYATAFLQELFSWPAC